MEENIFQGTAMPIPKEKKNSWKYFWIGAIFIFLLIGIYLFLGNPLTENNTDVNSGDIQTDNSKVLKQYDPIKNEVNLTNKTTNTSILTAKLDTPQVHQVLVGYSKIAEFTINPYEDYQNVLEKVELTDLKTSQTSARNIDIKYWGLKNYTIDDYDCVTFDDKNGTQGMNCSIIGSHIEQRQEWLNWDKNVYNSKEVKVALFMNIGLDETFEWVPTIAGVEVTEWAIVTSGATISYYLDEGNNYTIITYINNGTFNTTSTINTSILVVAGGGGGGGSYYNQGGGGAGGIIYNNSFSVVTGNYNVVVGTGGAGGTLTSANGENGVNGQNSSIKFTNGTVVKQVFGGGGGGAYDQNGVAGGSGGGSGGTGAGGGAGVAGQGNNGASPGTNAGGGGGGKGAVGGAGASNGFGGNGTAYNISNGTLLFYGGGGGGGNGCNGGYEFVMVGGLGGGGNGAIVNADCDGAGNDYPDNGTASTGGGGGGGALPTGIFGGSGGSGTVIIKYLTSSNSTISSININLISPVNNYNSSSNNINFSSTVIPSQTGIHIVNVSLLINGTINQTTNLSQMIAQNSSFETGFDSWINDSGATRSQNWASDGTWSVFLNGASFGSISKMINLSDVDSIIFDVNVTSLADTVGLEVNNTLLWSAPATGIISNVTVDLSNLSSFYNLEFISENSGAPLGAMYLDNIRLIRNSNFSLTTGNGYYNWSVIAFGNNSIQYNASNGTFVFTVDATAPTLSAFYPTGNVTFHERYQNLQLNWSVNDSHKDACLFQYKGVNTTVTCSNNQTTINITDGINKTLIFFANDTFGNMASQNVTWDYRLFQNSETYSSPVLEGASSTFTIAFLTNGSDITIGNLSYNNTQNLASISDNGNNNFTLSVSVNVPVVVANSNISFYWSIFQGTGFNYNITAKNQSVTEISIDNCAVNTNLLFNFTLYNEENPTVKLSNTTIEYAFNIYNSARTLLIVSTNSSSSTNPTAICLNSSITNSSANPSLDGRLKYFANATDTDYTIKYYNYLNYSVNNASINKSVALYSINSTKSLPFLLTFRGTTLALAPNILVYVNKQFLPTNDFKTVEVPMTDSNGQTILNLVRNTAVYNLIMIDITGNVVASFSNIIAFCQDFTIGSCAIELSAPSTGEGTYNYSTDVGISYSVTYSNSSKLVSLAFNSINSSNANVRLLVTTENQFENKTICSSSLDATLGTITCNLTSSLGNNQYFFAHVFSNGNLIDIIPLNANPSFGSTGGSFGADGFFIAVLMMLFIILLFAEDKQALIIGIGLGWVCVITLGLIKGTLIGLGSGGIWLVITLIIFLWKLSKEDQR